MEKHITLVAVIQITLSIIGIIIGMVLFVLLSGIGIFIGEDEASFILPIIGIIIGGFLILSSIVSIIGAIGLLKKKAWSRILLLVVSVLDLLNIPIGTAVGVYTIWVLMQDETVALLQS
ncbi:MAG: hypothetical protein KKB34_01305 [Bacteroidetes bacterium]|nr:hypothetical protein [Bacteroidota bacterium]